MISKYSTGAGQDVGRSCIIVSFGGKNIMLDCGMHMGFNDDVSTGVIIVSNCLHLNCAFELNIFLS